MLRKGNPNKLLRRLSYFVQQRVAITVPGLSTSSTPPRRRYGKASHTPKSFRSPTVRKLEDQKRDPKRPPPQPDSKHGYLFVNDKELLEIFERGVPFFQFELTPLACLEATKTYCTVLSEDERTSGNVLEQNYDISPYKLHLLGIMLLAGGSFNMEHWKLATQMLQTASVAGYMPSTMTILRLFGRLREKSGKTGVSSRLFQNAQALFRNYLTQSPEGKSDPNALTLAGLMSLSARDDMQALKRFREAEKAGSARVLSSPQEGMTSGEDGAELQSQITEGPSHPRATRWTWEPSCLLSLGRICLKLGQLEEAKAALRTAALEVDNPEAYHVLADLLPPNAPERATYLTKAAISGVPGAAQLLSKLESENAGSASGQKAAAEHSLMAKEWLAIASAEPALTAPSS